MYRGRFIHTIDKKGRVSIPMAFRQALAEQSDLTPMITNQQQCLALYSRDDWDRKEEQLAQASQLNPSVQAYQRFLISGAVECPIDGQGRILIPAPLREHARLDREVMIAGVGPHIEIWDKTLFDQDLQATATELANIAREVEDSARSTVGQDA